MLKIFKKIKPKLNFFKLKLKNFLHWDFYENIVVAVLKFFIRRNPISPFYAFWKTLFVAKEWKSFKSYFAKFDKYFSSHHPFASAFSSFLFLTLIFVGVFQFAFNRNTEEAKADWWDESWGFRREITLTNASGGELSDFQVNVVVDTATLITAGKMQSDCDDMRFTDINGVPIPFWLDEGNPGCNNAATRIWLKIPTLYVGTNTTKVYFYYDNEVAENKGSGLDTFEFFDDFENVARSEGLWQSAFEGTAGTWTIGSGYAQLTNGSGAGAIALSSYSGTDYIAEARTMHVGSTGAAMGLSARGDLSGNYYHQEIDESRLNLYRFNNWGYTALGSSSGFSISANTWYTAYLKVIGTSISGYSYTHDVVFSATDANLASGRAGVEVYSETARFDDFRVRKVTSTMPTSAVSASEEISPAPVGYWGFDEGYGVTAFDESGKDNNGTIASATWKNESECVTGKCLKFDGTNDLVDIGDDDEFTITNNGFSVSAWIRFDSLTAAAQGNRMWIVSKGNTSNYEWGMSYNDFYSPGFNVFNFGYWSADGNSASRMRHSLTNPEVGKWYHITATVADAGGSVTPDIYINGILDNGTTSGGGTPIPVNTTSSVLIGEREDGAEFPFDGKIDEVKIYPYVRTSAQIKADYNAGTAGAKTKTGTDVSFGGKSEKWMTDGLVGHWKMDEVSWNGTSGEVLDASGSGNNGTRAGDATTTGGKYGNGGIFDGVGDRVTVPYDANLASSNFTVSFWTKRDVVEVNSLFKSAGGNGYNSGFAFLSSSISLSLRWGDGVNAESSISGATTSGTSEWNHVVGTFDGTSMRLYIDGVLENEDNTVTLGYSGTDIQIIGYSSGVEYYEGKIDEVRVYNRAFSLEEVQGLYHHAPGPVAHWKFDEMSGITARDVSGNGNDGTLTSGPTWENVGKYGGALRFDGNNDHIMVPYSPELYSENMTIGFWAKSDITNYPGANAYVVSMYDFQTNNRVWAVRITASTDRWSVITSGDGSNTSSDDSAHPVTTDMEYITMVADNSSNSWKFYLNGILSETLSLGPSYSNQNSFMTLGGLDAPNSFDGVIDDVKMYNYARTERQILEDMNAGKSALKSPLLHLSFDEGRGTTAFDGSSFGNDGTLISSPTWINDGIFGGALEFDGADNYVEVGNIDYIAGSDFSVCFWSKLNGGSDLYQTVIAQKSSGIGNFLIHNTGYLYWDRGAGGQCDNSNEKAWSDNEWHHSCVLYDGSEMTQYVDKELIQTCSVSTSDDGSHPIYIGRFGDDLFRFKGDIDDVKMYNFELTADEVSQEYQNGISGVSLNGATTMAMGGLNENKQKRDLENGLEAHWKMDEASWDGTVDEVKDSSGNSRDGQAVNGVTTSAGRFDNAGNFDGANDYINFPDFNPGETITLSVWVNPSTTNDGQNFVGKHLSDGDNVLVFGIWSGGYHFRIRSQAYDAGTVTTGWQHMVAVLEKNGTSTDVNIYKNGKILWSQTLTETIGDTTGLGWIVGQDWDVGPIASDFFGGQIDEVRIYDHALSGEEIEKLYQTSMGSILHLKMDEMSGASVYDSSGNSLVGTLENGLTWEPIGKIGSALKFDGIDGHVDLESTFWQNKFTDNDDFHISAWVKLKSFPANDTTIAGQRYGDAMVFGIRDTGELYLNMDDTRSGSPENNTAILLDEWYHVAVNYKGSDSSHAVEFFLNGDSDGTGTSYDGNGSGSLDYLFLGWQSRADIGATDYFDGLIDDVKIYDYNLSPRQVAMEFNGGKPVAHWKMDKGEGLTVYDWSGNGNVGTMTNMDGVTDWTIGKIGKALDFDGTDDFVTIASDDVLVITGDVTMSAWVKADSFSSDSEILQYGMMGESLESNVLYSMYVNAAGNLSTVWEYGAGSNALAVSNATVSTGSWQHVVVTRDVGASSLAKFYVNGKLEDTKTGITNSAGGTAVGANLLIGRDVNSAQEFSGAIDDVRIHNYTLTDEEVERIYNGGAMRFE